MKDEGPFLLEWLAYHQAIGFTDFLIYTNDCSDGTDLLLDRLMQAGEVCHVRNQVLRRGAHKSALKYAKEHPLYAAANWVFVSDADEFLNIKTGNGRLDDLIAAYPGADVIPVTWRLFSCSSIVDFSDQGLLNTLVECEPSEAERGAKGRFVKTLFRPTDQIERLGLHGPILAEGARDNVIYGGHMALDADEDNPERPSRAFGYDIAQVNHYAVRTVDSFLFKRYRGRANHMGQDIGLDYWTRWSGKGAVDTSIQRKLKDVAAGVERLRSDPVVDHLHQAAVEIHHATIQRLKGDADFAKMRDAILGHEGLSDAAAPAKPRRYANRMRLLQAMPPHGKCAEIGVWNGGFSQSILDVAKPKELILIDPWDLIAETTDDTKTHSKHSDAQAMREMFEHVAGSFGSTPGVKIERGFSADVLAGYPDDYFDWVYIDGNHLYDFVYRDVRLSFDKVRPGGIIAGDDFFWKRDGRMHVKDAVLDVMAELGLPGRPKRFGQQFMIEVPQ